MILKRTRRGLSVFSFFVEIDWNIFWKVKNLIVSIAVNEFTTVFSTLFLIPNRSLPATSCPILEGWALYLPLSRPFWPKSSLRPKVRLILPHIGSKCWNSDKASLQLYQMGELCESCRGSITKGTSYVGGDVQRVDLRKENDRISIMQITRVWRSRWQY